MKKETIFLATTLIIAVLVCGAVSAADNTNSGTTPSASVTTSSAATPAESSTVTASPSASPKTASTPTAVKKPAAPSSAAASSAPATPKTATSSAAVKKPAASSAAAVKNPVTNLPVTNDPPTKIVNVYPGQSIQTAINSLGTLGNGIVRVFGHNVVYSENIVINAPNIILEAAKGATVTIQALTPTIFAVEIDTGGTGSIVRGFTITGGYDAVALVNVGNVQIKRNTITHGGFSGISIVVLDGNTYSGNIITENTITNNQSDGIEINALIGNTSGNIITKNTITNNQSDGIVIYYGSDNTVSRNTITNNNQDGVYLVGSSGNTVSRNTITNNGWDGVTIYKSNGNTVSGNKIIGNGWDGITVSDSSGNKIIRNWISKNGYQGTDSTTENGIYIANSGIQQSPNIILGNTITNNKADGIWLDDNSNYNWIVKNEITDNAWDGISITDSSGNKIIRNWISKNGYQGTDSTTENGIYIANSGTQQSPNTITGNAIIHNNNDGILIQDDPLGSGSVAEIHYNSIVHNGQYGLEDLGIGTVNAINNWWGSNQDPITSGQAINTGTGTLYTTPWLKHPPHNDDKDKQKCDKNRDKCKHHEKCKVCEPCTHKERHHEPAREESTETAAGAAAAVPMQATGVPIAAGLLGMLMVAAGLILPRKR